MLQCTCKSLVSEAVYICVKSIEMWHKGFGRSFLGAWLGCGPSQSCRGLSAVAASYVPAVVAGSAPGTCVPHILSLSSCTLSWWSRLLGVVPSLDSLHPASSMDPIPFGCIPARTWSERCMPSTDTSGGSSVGSVGGSKCQSCSVTDVWDVGGPFQVSWDVHTKVWALLDLLQDYSTKAVEKGGPGCCRKDVAILCIKLNSPYLCPFFQPV